MEPSAYHPFRSQRAKEEYHALYREREKAWPVAFETKLIETPSGQTFCRISGNPSDAPLILLPGARGTSLTWIPNIAALSARYCTYSLDSIHDFGMSIRRKKINKPDDVVKWLEEVLAVIFPDGRFGLIGLSYGGWLASQYALRFPERVNGVVLLSPAETMLPVSFSLLFRAILTVLPFGNFKQRFYYWLLRDALQSGETGRAYVDEAVADWEVAERCFTRLPLVSASVHTDAELEQLAASTLYLVGENEKMYSASQAINRLKRLAPQMQTELVPHAGHDLWYVRAGRVNELIIRFFEKKRIP